ncbi:PEP-CTERM sorting domain-containing protein [Kiritimatiellota bacterium B12222]|nr:PEP-CTERM sorting domain-containing protein [Kiritimatiellota bacterium B12222]
MKNPFTFVPKILLGTILLAANAPAAINTWNNSSADGNWDTAANWSDGVPSSSDQAIIDNGDLVTKTGDLTLGNLRDSNEDGLRLTNGTLNVSGNYTSYTSWGGSGAIINDLGLSSGATTGTLNIGGTFNLGNTDSSSGNVATFNIYSGSSLSANAFQGKQGAGGNAGSGGWAFNISGGSLNIIDTFDFSTLTTPDSSNPAGQLILGTTGTASGGTVTVGTMSDDWARDGQYVLFNDNLASLTFGKTNYSDLANVQTLIDNNYIRKDASVTDGFNIADNGSTWTVSIIPEPSTFILMLGGLLAMAVPLRRRK